MRIQGSNWEDSSVAGFLFVFKSIGDCLIFGFHSSVAIHCPRWKISPVLVATFFPCVYYQIYQDVAAILPCVGCLEPRCPNHLQMARG